MNLLRFGLPVVGLATAYLWKAEQDIPRNINDLSIIASTAAGLAVNVFSSKVALGVLGTAGLNVAFSGTIAFLAIKSVENTFESAFKNRNVKNPFIDTGMRVLNFFHLTATSTTCFFRAVQVVWMKAI